MQKFLLTDNEDCNQTACMRMLIRVFVGGMSEGTFSDVAIRVINFD